MDIETITDDLMFVVKAHLYLGASRADVAAALGQLATRVLEEGKEDEAKQTVDTKRR